MERTPRLKILMLRILQQTPNPDIIMLGGYFSDSRILLMSSENESYHACQQNQFLSSLCRTSFYTACLQVIKNGPFLCSLDLE